MAKKEKQPQYYVSKTGTQMLNYSVYVFSASEKMLYSLILLAAGGCAGLIFYGGLFKNDGEATLITMISNVVVFILFGLLAIKIFTPMIEESLKKKRMLKLNKQFVDFASALANALAGGMNVNDSLNAAYDDLKVQYSEEALIVREVGEIINGVYNNIPVEEMLSDFGRRSGIADISNFAVVFATCYRAGGNIKSIVRRTAEIISEKTMIASEIETAMTSNKMQMNIMNVLPFLIVLMMRLMSRDFSESFSSVVGVIGLTVCAGLTMAAYKMGRKITNIKG